MKILLSMLVLTSMSSSFAASMDTVIVAYQKARSPDIRDLDKTKWKCSVYDSNGVLKLKSRNKSPADLAFMAIGRETLMNQGGTGLMRYDYDFFDKDELRGKPYSNSSGSENRETLRIGSDKKLYSLYESKNSTGWVPTLAKVCKQI